MPGSARLVLFGLLLLLPRPVAQTPVWRVNCGGPELPAPSGHPFTADQAYGALTHAGYVGAHTTVVDNADSDNGGLTDPYREIHATARVAWVAWRFDVAPGDYILRLHLSEVDEMVHGPGIRVFDVVVEGQPWLEELDLAAVLGIRYAGEFVGLVHVADGRLDVEAPPGASQPILNAVEVWKLAGPPPAPAAVTGFLAKGGYARNILSWDPTLDPAVAGFAVFRAPAPQGPWQAIGFTWAAPPRFFDEDPPVGVPLHYRVAAVNVAGQLGAASAALPAAALDPAQSLLRIYELAVDPADIQAIDLDVVAGNELEVPATFTHAGESWDVTVRYRGDGTLLLSKKSWKIEFPPDQSFEGRTDLNLKAHFLDESLVREGLVSELFADVRHPVSAQEAVHLVVNGVFRGVFNDFEQVDERYLLSRDRDPGGSIYKAGVLGANLGPLPSLEDYETTYEKKTNEASGHADIIALIEMLADQGLTPLQLADVFDVDDYLDYLAVVGWTGDADQIQRNFYLLHDLALERWEWISWDNDRTFWSTTVELDHGTSSCEECGGVNVLKDRVLAEPAFAWRFAEKLKALMAGAASFPALSASIAERHARIEVDARADVAKNGWEIDTPFLDAPAGLVDFILPRDAFVLAFLAGWQPPAPPTAVWINEFMADNERTLSDEAGDFDGWIELYNASAAPVDVGGMVLTDDLADPGRWPLPAGTVIVPHGWLLVWADGEDAEGPLHAGFELSAAGGEIGLIAADGATLLDVYHYRPQLEDVSEGRAGDGGAVFLPMPQPSPLGPNSTAGNLPPVITWVASTPPLPASWQPIVISCQVKDDEPPLQVTLSWRANDGPFTTAPMQPIGNERYAATIPAQPDGTLVEHFIEATDALSASATKPAGAPEDLDQVSVGDPLPGGVRINEFMADNDSTISDETGAFEDWLELVNTTGGTIDLSGMHLTDDLAAPAKWTLPPGTLLGAHEQLLIWADEDPDDGPLHAGFKLSKGGESLGLFDAQGAFLDGFAFGLQSTDVSTGLLPDGLDVVGASPRVSLLEASPGAPNLPLPGASLRYDAALPGDTPTGLSAVGGAQLGAPLVLTLGGAPPAGAGLLVVGLAPLQIHLDPFGALLVLPLFDLTQAFTTDGSGGAAPSLAIPSKPSLVGLTLYVQAYVAGGGLSNAVATTLGD